MKIISAYLTFNGNCREAMQFYQRCIGGELTVQTIGDSPMAEQFPPHLQQNVLHATITSENVLLYGSDMVSDGGLITGNAVSLMLDCSSEQEIKHCYGKLAEDGIPTHPLEITFWGALFGNLTDKFGNHWLLHYTNKEGQVE